MNKIKKKFFNLPYYWRIPSGMIIGGSLAVTSQIFLPSEATISHGQMFIVGAFVLGLIIGGIWHGSYNGEAQDKEHLGHLRSYNREYIITDKNHYNREQRLAHKRSWYINDGVIFHYSDELTPDKVRFIKRHSAEIEKIKEELIG
jgi:hypothetical protein